MDFCTHFEQILSSIKDTQGQLYLGAFYVAPLVSFEAKGEREKAVGWDMNGEPSMTRIGKITYFYFYLLRSFSEIILRLPQS